MSTLSVGTIKSNTTSPPVIQNSSNTEVGTFCRAWVSFFGGTAAAGGTVSINNDFNVATITDNAIGDYTVVFSNDMVDANYCAVGLGGNDNFVTDNSQTGHALRFYNAASTLAGSVRVLNAGYGAGLIDAEIVGVAIFR